MWADSRNVRSSCSMGEKMREIIDCLYKLECRMSELNCTNEVTKETNRTGIESAKQITKENTGGRRGGDGMFSLLVLVLSP